MRLKDIVAVVTGSGQGLGRATAKLFAKEGARVVIAARTEEVKDERLPGTIDHTAGLIEDAGGEALPVVCNVADAESIEAMTRQVADHWGRVDILMNNAAIQPPGGNVDITPKHWQLQYLVNVHGPFQCIRSVLPMMRAQGGGSIINVSSAATLGGSPYGGSKRALEAMTEGFADELKAEGIAANALKPVNIIETPGYLFAQVPRDEPGSAPELPPSDSYVEAAVLLALQTPDTFTGQVHNDAEVIGLLSDAETQARFRALNPDYWSAIMDGVR